MKKIAVVFAIATLVPMLACSNTEKTTSNEMNVAKTVAPELAPAEEPATAQAIVSNDSNKRDGSQAPYEAQTTGKAVIDSAKKDLKDAGQQIKAGVNKLADDVKPVLKDGAEEVKKGVQKVGEEVKKTSENIKEGLK